MIYFEALFFVSMGSGIAPVSRGLELRVGSLPEGSGDADIESRYALEPALNFAVGLGVDGGCTGDLPCIGDDLGC